jgi:hypothetical protein
LSRIGRECIIEGRIRGHDQQLAIENDERLTHGIDDAVGIGAAGLDLMRRHLHLRDIGVGDDDALDFALAGSIRQDATHEPLIAGAIDLASDWMRRFECLPGIRQ